MKQTKKQILELAIELTEPVNIIREQIYAILRVMRKLNGIGILPESPLIQELDGISIQLDNAYRQVGHVQCQLIQDDDFLQKLYN